MDFDLNPNTLQESINQLEIRFDEIRNEVIAKLNQCNECIHTAQKLCQQAIQMTTF